MEYDKSVKSEYALSLAMMCRNNPDNSMPFNRDAYLEYDNGDGTVERRIVTGGVYGKLGNADITKINAATGVYLEFVEINKKDKVPINLSPILTPTVAPLEAICDEINKSINKFSSFPVIKHGFHASVKNNRLFVNADIPISVTGIPTFVDGEFEFPTTTATITIKEGTLTSDSVSVTTDDTNPTAIADFIDALNIAISGATFPNSGHTFIAYEDNGQVKIKTGLEIPEYVPLTIQNSHDVDGEVDSVAADVLELNKSYWLPIKHVQSITVAQDSTDSEEISNEDSTGIVTTIKTDQQVTGQTITLVDAERNDVHRVAMTGGCLVGNKATPKKSGVKAPNFGLLLFSPVFDEGTYGISGSKSVVMEMYPSCTAVLENNDKNQKGFNNDSYSITAADGASVAAGTRIDIGNDMANGFQAIVNM